MSKPLWTFSAYVSEAGGNLVQDWYDTLPEEEFEELQDNFNYLAYAPEWRRPRFDKVRSPLHEIRSKANLANHQIRVYGVFSETRHDFLLLLGVTAKKKDNDAAGQQKALDRLSLLKQGKASAHGFFIEDKSSRESKKGQVLTLKVGGIQLGQRTSASDSRHKKT